MTLNDTIKTYLDKRILWVFLMGCASGFPWVLIASALAAWLKDAGVSRTDIGLVGIAYGIYAFNFLWAPLVDRVNIPAITRIGQRKSWIILTQGAMAALTSLSGDDPLAGRFIGPSRPSHFWCCTFLSNSRHRD